MTPKLFHISEEQNIQIFKPRVSKKQWNNKLYVWAISEEKIYNYYFPRECPRICINLEKSNISKNWLNFPKEKSTKAIIFVPEKWEERIEKCTLFQYEFNNKNFKLIDEIAGYYVSNKTELPTNQIRIKNCKQELKKLKVELVISNKEHLQQIKDKVITDLKEFSIIRWSNF